MIGAILFGLGSGYLMGRFRWVIAVLVVVIGLFFLAGYSMTDYGEAWTVRPWQQVVTIVSTLAGFQIGERQRVTA